MPSSRRTTRAPARSRPPRGARRTQIAEAALRLIGERGIGGLTMANLAKAVGVTSGALFRHFPSREAILDGAVDAALSRLEGTFPAESLPPLERILALAEARVAMVGGHTGYAWLLLSDHAAHALSNESVWKLEGFVRRSRRFLLEALEEGAASGAIRSDIPPSTLLLPLVGTIHMLLRAPGAHRAAFGGEDQTSTALSALRLLLAGDHP